MISELINGLLGRIPYVPAMSGTDALSLASSLESELFRVGSSFKIDFGDSYGKTDVVYAGKKIIPVINHEVYVFSPKFDESMEIYFRQESKIKYWEKI